MSAWQIIRRYHLHLIVVSVIRLVAGRETAGRYIDRTVKGKT